MDVVGVDTCAVSSTHSNIPLVLYKAWHPVGSLVSFQKLVLHLLHTDEPGGHSAVDEWRVRPPAEGLAVIDCRCHHQPSPDLQLLDDGWICFLHVPSLEVPDSWGEAPGVIHGADGFLIIPIDEAIAEADAEIILAKVRSLVYHART